MMIALGKTAAARQPNSGTCSNNTSLWRVMLDATSGKCFNICEKEGIVFEIDPSECRGLVPGQSRAMTTAQASSSRSWYSSQTIIQGVPNWMVVIGAFVIIGIVMNN